MSKKMPKILVLFLGLVMLLAAFPLSTGAMDVNDVTNWVNGKEQPKPQVMVSGFEIEPEVLMAGDEAVVTITLENTQDKPITGWKRDIKYDHRWSINKTKAIYEDEIIDADTTITLTMDACIKEAYISCEGIKVYNKYRNVGALGPGRELDLAFKIKAPLKDGIYIVNFNADIEDTDDNRCKSIRYQFPLTVSSTVELIPKSTTESIKETGIIRLEVVNKGLGDAESITVISKSEGLVLEPGELYVGELIAGKSTAIEFKLKNVTDYGRQIVAFEAEYKNGINKHKSKPVFVCTNHEPQVQSPESVEGNISAVTVRIDEVVINNQDSFYEPSVLERIISLFGLIKTPPITQHRFI